MSTSHAPSGSDTPPAPGGGKAAWATGGTLFAGVLMLLYGLLGAVQGVAGVAEDDVYARVGDYVFKFDLTSWGWIHLAMGVVVAVAGLAVLTGAGWARAFGVVLAVLAVLANFLWLPYQPLWALVSIGIGVFVIWALCTDHGNRPR